MDQEFKVVAHLSAFELTKFGNSETFFVIAELEMLTAEKITAFSSVAFQYALKSKAFPLPRGLFESVWCFAVCVADELDEAIGSSVRNGAPTRHWSAAEIPVVYDRGTEQIYYFEKSPTWGAAYYQGFRNQIQKYLVFH